jgi:kynurenine formamidase
MRTKLAAGISLVAVIIAGIAVMKAQSGGSNHGGSDHHITKEQYEKWKKDPAVSNWGRWGKDDELGTYQLITAAKRKQAAGLVKEGFSVSLASDPDTVKSVDNPNPYEHEMQGIGSDRWGVSYHGQTHTHLDALGHINEQGTFFNGYKPDPEAVLKANGHSKESIHNLKNGIFTRGVLYDMPRLNNVKYLAPSTPIYVEDLEAWEKQSGVKVGSGDVLIVRTGVYAKRKEVGPYARGRNATDPGLDPSVIPWLRKRDVALMASDHPQYVSPSEVTAAAHDFAILYLGMNLIDNCDLEALADAAAARKRWDFLITFAPIPMPGGTGSPINPIATF